MKLRLSPTVTTDSSKPHSLYTENSEYRQIKFAFRPKKSLQALLQQNSNGRSIGICEARPCGSIMNLIYNLLSSTLKFSCSRKHTILRQCTVPKLSRKRVKTSDGLTPSLVKTFMIIRCATDEGTSCSVMTVLTAMSN
ncbi:hypothetical protein J6590_080116 [Homalodisca vitripennis]|nr:hypothetical protein J6590_080116 [Homalodisca vitripennis]